MGPRLGPELKPASFSVTCVPVKPHVQKVPWHKKHRRLPHKRLDTTKTLYSALEGFWRLDVVTLAALFIPPQSKRIPSSLVDSLPEPSLISDMRYVSSNRLGMTRNAIS